MVYTTVAASSWVTSQSSDRRWRANTLAQTTVCQRHARVYGIAPRFKAGLLTEVEKRHVENLFRCDAGRTPQLTTTMLLLS